MTDLHPATVTLLRTLSESHTSSGEAVTARLRWLEAGRPDLPAPSSSPGFGAWLRARREHMDLSQRDLATALAGFRGCHQSAVSRWERGEQLPDIAQLGELAAALDLQVDEVAEATRLAREDAGGCGDRRGAAPADCPVAPALIADRRLDDGVRGERCPDVRRRQLNAVPSHLTRRAMARLDTLL